MVALADEIALGRIELQQPMNGPRRPPGRLAESLGSPSCRGAQLTTQPLGGEDLKDAADNGRFAHTWSAGDNHKLALDSLPDRIALRWRQFQSHFGLDPCQCLFDIDRRQRMTPAPQRLNALCNSHFRQIQGFEVKPGIRILPAFPNDRPLLTLVLDGGDYHI